MFKTLAAAVLGMASLSASAYVLDFGSASPAPSICSSSVAGTGAMVGCASWSYINQSYGDVAGVVDVSYDQPLHTGNTLRWWAGDYNNLYGVAFSDGGDGPGSHARIELKAGAANSLVTLTHFDLGAYPNTTRGTIVDIYEIGSTASLFHYDGNVGAGANPTSFAVNVSSSKGLWLEFRNSAYNVGIDNVEFNVSSVPEPESYALMLAGLAAVGAVARRRR